MKNNWKSSIIINLIGFFIARASFLGINPLAAGYFIAAYLGNNRSAFILVTVSMGVLTAMPVGLAFKYLLSIIAAYIILEMPIIKKNNIPKVILYSLPATIVGVFTLIEGASVGLNTVFVALTLLEVFIAYASGMIFSAGVNYFSKTTKGVRMSNEQMVSLSLILAIVVFTFPEINNAYIAPMQTIVYFLVLFITYKYGVGSGAVAGALAGFALTLRGGQVSDMAGLTMMAIATSIFRGLGRIPAAAIFTLSAVTFESLSPDMVLSIREIGALVSAVVLFLLFPRSIAYQVVEDDAFIDKREQANHHLKKIADAKIRTVSDSFAKLSKTLVSIKKENQEMIEKEDKDNIFEEISEKLCKDCQNSSFCWEKNFEKTYQVANTIFEIAEKNGEIKKEEVPRGFTDMCICADQFLAETNRGFEIAKLNHIWNNRMRENREVFAEQLKEVSGVMDQMTGEIFGSVQSIMAQEEKIIRQLRAGYVTSKNVTIIKRKDKRKEIHLDAAAKRMRYVLAKDAADIIGDVLGVKVKVSEACNSVIDREFKHFVFVEDTKFKVLTGMARTMKGNVSGDNFSILKMEKGEVMMALADGMGTGKEAGDESEAVMGLLEQLVEADFKIETAIKLINSSMVLKADNQMFSTIDICVINLFTGISEFVKIGAATTFIKRDNWVETISSTTLPIGMLGNVDYDAVIKKLYEGDIVIMVTDGILDSIKEKDKESYMERKIMEIKSTNPQEIANTILDHALAQSNYIPGDDMTVLTAGIWLK